MGTYASKPMIIEAIQWTGDNLNEIIDYVERSVTVDAYILKRHNIATLTIPYFRGRNVVNMSIEPYDYIIRGLNDSLYIMNKDDFKKIFVEIRKKEE